MQTQIQMGVSMLLRAAAKRADPEIYANWVLDMVDEDEARAFVTNEAQWQQMMQANPPIAEHRAWFDELRAILIEFLTDEGAGDTSGQVKQPEGAPDAPGTKQQ